MEELDPEIFAVITDSTAFTLYILHDRKVGDDQCGKVLAELCERDGDEDLIREGNTLAEEYRALFSGIILQTMIRKTRQDFEFRLIQTHQQYLHLSSESSDR